MNSAKKKTDTFFIISNYNTDPAAYLEYCEDYHIYDQSTDPKMVELLKSKYNDKISYVQNTGHNITDYFRFFIDRYDRLPERMMLAKGNMIGRHVTLDFFEKVYSSRNYTLMYSDRKWKDKVGVAYHLYEGAFLEINNSWYMPIRPPKYFNSFNAVLSILFKDPILPEWVLFSPGACHIVLRDQIRKYPKSFYENLMIILDYTYFPSEAYIIERMLHIIFTGTYELNEDSIDPIKFRNKLKEFSARNSVKEKASWFQIQLRRLKAKRLKWKMRRKFPGYNE
jgi:hypothetical protein